MAGAKEIKKGEILRGIPADSWNAFCRTTKFVDQMQKRGNGPGQSAGNSTLTFEVVNTTGEDITADRPILKLSAPTLTTEDDEGVIWDGIRFDGTTPDSETQIDEIAILQGPVADEDGRNAVIAGPTWVDVDITDATHTHAAPKAEDNTKLESATSGTKMHWKESGTGTKKAVVILGAGGGAGVSIKIVLIEDDFDGIVELEDVELTDEYATLEEPEGTEVDALPLWAYERQTVNLKYYRAAGEGDPGYDPYEDVMILATEETDEGSEGIFIRYSLTPVKTDDGEPFLVGNYKQSDFLDWPENAVFPDDVPEGFSIKKRYRGIVINGVLLVGLCQVVPAPPLPEES